MIKKYFSTFSGIGAPELALEYIYEDLHGRASQSRDDHGRAFSHDYSSHVEGRPLCAGYSEIDKYATEIYQKHFPTHKNYGDITRIDEMELPEFDLLIGGFPCQSFSIAGKRGWFSDTRGTLFFDVARIVRERRPRLLLLENVKGLLSHDEGRTFAIIISTLDELGYDLQWQLLNSKDFGVPQNRERVYIVGNLRGSRRPQVFPLFGADKEDSKACKHEQQGKESVYIKTRHLGQNGGLTSDIAGTMQAAEIPHVTVGTLRTHRDGEGFRESKSGMVPTIPARSREDGSGQPVIKDDLRIRRLTPTECERLQGFPDGWTAGPSDSQRYKMLGNSMTVNVMKEILTRMM